MRTRIAVLALTFLTVNGLAVFAQQPGTPFTGMELYTACNDADVGIRIGCRTYINGYAEGFIAGQQVLQQGQLALCLPIGVSGGQTELIVQKSMRDNPTTLNQSASLVVAKALLDAFKCKPGEVPTYGQAPK